MQVPVLFKNVIDEFGTHPESLLVPSPAINGIVTVAGAMLLGYGAARFGASLFQELRNVVFAKVSQAALRTIARNTFMHLLQMDLSWHLSRQTGGLSRAIDRGTKLVGEMYHRCSMSPSI